MHFIKDAFEIVWWVRCWCFSIVFGIEIEIETETETDGVVYAINFMIILMI